MSIQLRECQASDSDILLLWRNSEKVRSVSRETKKISLSEHSDWFRDRLARVDLEPFWIVTLLGNSIGYIRFDKIPQIEKCLEISILLTEQNRSTGFGKIVLIESITKFQNRFTGEKIRATIKENNIQSIKLFESVGFEFVGVECEFSIYELCAE
jgi:RimJ/RimL family protein N-acetyltransferase